MNWSRKKDKSTNEYFYLNEETGEQSKTKPKEGFRIYHILIKHNKSRKPVNRTPEDALEKCKNIYNSCKLKINDKDFRMFFMDLAKKESECSSNKRGGDLGLVVKNEMVKEFEKACLILKCGGIVGPVKTESGYHIVYRRW
ncbi:Peptidyl-prolyl cis-trans isomerase NIMA-interacting 1 [Nosema bombycis CQ1]|uniref:Peptidyl-prolyl cis-trans isomerase n=1 Tax=Nosema bombycis (strain CQ1 / CVCC 102059) TaxID=578461 RepID=R0MDM2_NOSB1|nr:Peptidyl-prolyl cis-trans isomerase NIMA-interacting 1 [Nosema bombycis CQ1]|eukprot:EOB12180.1 Peptidyl-prolyl cis-trans isomerase NIMA-interacting 1 [Nosema bombycis CQ1]